MYLEVAYDKNKPLGRTFPAEGQVQREITLFSPAYHRFYRLKQCSVSGPP